MEARCEMLFHSVGTLAESAKIVFSFHLATSSSSVTAASGRLFQNIGESVLRPVYGTRTIAFNQTTDT